MRFGDGRLRGFGDGGRVRGGRFGCPRIRIGLGRYCRIRRVEGGFGLLVCNLNVAVEELHWAHADRYI